MSALPLSARRKSAITSADAAFAKPAVSMAHCVRALFAPARPRAALPPAPEFAASVAGVDRLRPNRGRSRGWRLTLGSATLFAASAAFPDDSHRVFDSKIASTT
jgi:hypothetical protein